ncbi:hypothetical protein [Kutzneria buriramensis]|uniref:Uncharacterized protein n=1 Tax=Kutzneria buriramensis TaxID=1045776 RepID=A0A3E0GV25_9PSEU|nr:hypothetical protein [Kutzneria buriramensis]REH27018.1 hypothetical protein BCF44_13173 [Kutzneria buriramensis]
MADVRWLTDEQGDAWISFVTMGHMVRHATERALQVAGTDLTLAKYELLHCGTCESERRIRMGELATVSRHPETC